MASPSTARIDPDASTGPRLSLAGWFRIGCRLVALLATLLFMVPLHYLTHALGQPSHWPRRFLGTAASIVGADVQIVGTPSPRNVFFIANHLSWIDILAMGGASGTAFIAKAELASVPVIGWLCSLNRTLYVSREDKLGVSSQIAMLRDAMGENHAVAVFPEGTTTDGLSLLPFKSSLLAVLEPPPPGIVVQPVYIDYGSAIADIAWIGQESGKDNALRILSRRGRFTIRLHFLAPFDPLAYAGRKAIAAESRARIEAELVATLGHRLRPFTGHPQP